MKEWQEGRAPNADGLCGNPESWTIEHWAQVLGLCAGEEGIYTYDSQSVKVIQAEEKTFAKLFKTQLFVQERMANDKVARSDETQCGSDTHADSATVKNDVHGNMVGRVRGAWW